jgi:adenine-specific DNA methylase
VKKLSCTDNSALPITLCYLDEVEDSTKVSISGVQNFELIPNDTLIQDLKVDMSPNPPSSDLRATQ